MSETSALSGYKEEINKALERFFGEVQSKLQLVLLPSGEEALELLKEYTVRSGKRIRGSLASLAYDDVAHAKYGKVGVQAGVALELLQSYLLIVDDVMDKSARRRGLPTVHTQYLQKQHDTFASDMLAVNVGLVAQHLANIVMAELPAEAKNTQQALKIMHRNIIATGLGQIEDLIQHEQREATEQDIIRKYQLKSSYYTFVNPLQLGLVLGGTDTKATLAQVEQLGLAAGVAFQLHDDILGIFGDAAATGKANTDDIVEGKYTVLVQFTLAHASPEEAQFVRSKLGTAVTQADFEHIKEIMQHCGAKKYVHDQAASYTQQAKEQLENSSEWSAETKQVLSELLDYITRRES